MDETDSPYLTRKGVRQPQPAANVAVTAGWLRLLGGDDPDVFGQALVDNFDRLVRVDG